MNLQDARCNNKDTKFKLKKFKSLLVTTVHGKCRHLNSVFFYSTVLGRPSTWIEAFQGQYILFVFDATAPSGSGPPHSRGS